MTVPEQSRIKQLLVAAGLGLTFAMPAAAQADDGQEPIDLFDQSGDNMEGQDVAVDTLGQIDMTVEDLEITKVLQVLSIQTQRNIVTSRNVSGKVSADLYGVSFHEALDAILIPNGYGYEEKGNFIYVYTAQELEERKNLLRKTETKIVRLNYLSATDAAAFLTPMLSQAGSITASAAPGSGILPSESDAGENSFALPDTLVIRDYEENVAEIEEVLSSLDVRPQQVLVEATILQATLTEQNAFGVDFAVFANFDALDFTNPLNAVDNLINGTGPAGDSGTAINSTAGNTQAGASNVKIGLVGSDAAVFLRALDSVTDNTVLARPNILVLNKQKADLLVGQRLGYLSTTVTDTSETQTIEFLDIGTQLTVRPWISDEGTIRLELRPSVSDGSTRLEGGFIIPDQTTQELVTNIIVESGQTVVLGGLFKEDTTVGRSQVPVLGDIPLVGAAFKGQDDNLQRSEVIFMIKTTVMDHSTLALMGEEAADRIENARIAIRDGLLPYSTDKLVSAHLLNARQHLEAGEKKKALWDVNLALHLSPTSGDALSLKEEITGEQLAYFDRSLFKDMTDDYVDMQMDSMERDLDMSPEEPLEAGGEDTMTEAELIDDMMSDAGETEAEQSATEPESTFSESIVVQIPLVDEVDAEPAQEMAFDESEVIDLTPQEEEFPQIEIETGLTGIDTMYDDYDE
jgi:type IV pilus assembly protein PilQ